MRRRPPFFAALILIAACAGAGVRPTSSTPTKGESTPDSTTTASTTTESTSTSSTPIRPPVAWVAPSGVPVAVTAVNGETIEVLTPCGDHVELSEGTPIHDVDVVIDPGHGGPIDTGAVGANGLAEKVINLQVGLAAQELLADRSIPSVLTRVGDYPMPIRTRSAFSDLVGAQAVVSLHHNAPLAPASDIPGVEIFVQSGSSESARLGGLIYDQTMAALARFDADWARAPDAGVMTVLNSDGEDAYGMVRRPEAPSALVELGYIANPAEAELYTNPEYVPAVASAVVEAIDTFLTGDEPGSPLVEGREFNPSGGVGRDQCIEPDLGLSLYPDVVDVSVTSGGGPYTFEVTLGSSYDSPERYADAWRVIGDDGEVYGVRELTHDHASEQPFTRSLAGVEIPHSVERVTIQGRDLVYGWGGGTFEVTLP